MNVFRRDFLKSAGALTASAGALAMAPAALAKLAPFTPGAGPRSRTIYVNDLSGDIDGLFATVHMLMSHTSQLRGIVAARALDHRQGSRFRDCWYAVDCQHFYHRRRYLGRGDQYRC